MAAEKKRFKAVIANQTYTIIGHESTSHMELVTKLVNEQLNEIKSLSPQMDMEQAAILLAVNAISDQLKKQQEVLRLQGKVDDMHHQVVKVKELENRVKRIEAIEKEARRVLEESGRGDVEIHSHVEAQQILNEERKRQIQARTAKDFRED